MHESCLLFEKSMGNSPHHIARALKFKGDSNHIKGLYKDQPLSSVQKKVAEELIYEYKETWQDKLVPFGCLALLACLLFCRCWSIYYLELDFNHRGIFTCQTTLKKKG